MARMGSGDKLVMEDFHHDRSYRVMAVVGTRFDPVGPG